MSDREVTLTVPLTITIRIGEPGTAPALAPAAPREAREVAEEAARPKAYFDGYQKLGYKPDFLGISVPLPVLTEEQRKNAAKNSEAGQGSDATVLPYTHFSLVMNRRRQLAYYTAVNIDGNSLQDLKRDTDKWFFDSRIAESEQIGESLYRKNALDRGHLVRRLDPVWGKQAEQANEDSFHFTNCSPQHELFNQGKDLWQGIENFILGRADARDRKVTVFTGPVTDESDPLYKGVRLPLAYWKIVVYVKDQQLAAAAYMLEQAELVQKMLSTEAAFEAGAFRVAIDHIIERTGLDFAYLKEHELPLAEGALEASTDRVRIAPDLSNLVL